MKQFAKIAVCDDDEKIHKDIYELLQKYSKQHPEEKFVYKSFHNEKQLLDYTEQIDLLFLDIEIGDKSGIDIVPLMQQKYPEIIIIFISSHTKYFVFSHRLNVFQFLTKPFDEIIFFEEVERFFEKYHKAKDMYILKMQNKTIKFPIYEIVYIEASLRHLKIKHSTTGIYEKTGQIGKEETVLKPYGFIRCHHGYLVNARYIESIKGQKIYLTIPYIGDPTKLMELPVSKNKLKQVRQQYQEWMQEQRN